MRRSWSLRFLFRLLAMISLAVAVIMAVLDATRTIAASQLVTTPLSTSWIAVSPDTLNAAQQFVRVQIHPLLWDPVIASVLALPGFAVFGVLAFLLYAIGRKPARRSSGRFIAEG
jgi:hypothetical protein